MRWIGFWAALVSLVLAAGSAVPAGAQAAPVAQSAAKVSAPASLLPEVFAGWAVDGSVKTVTDAAQADAVNAAALREYSLTGAALAAYKRDGETLSVRALRFHDASGAYGAYSFYRRDGRPREQIGAGATSDHNRVLFWLGSTVVDATFSRIGPMSGSELRELAALIPVPQGTKALPPPILANLPQASMDGQTTHYAVGPAGYAGGGVLPAELVGFDNGAETATATGRASHRPESVISLPPCSGRRPVQLGIAVSVNPATAAAP